MSKKQHEFTWWPNVWHRTHQYQLPHLVKVSLFMHLHLVCTICMLLAIHTAHLSKLEKTEKNHTKNSEISKLAHQLVCNHKQIILHTFALTWPAFLSPFKGGKKTTLDSSTQTLCQQSFSCRKHTFGSLFTNHIYHSMFKKIFSAFFAFEVIATISSKKQLCICIENIAVNAYWVILKWDKFEEIFLCALSISPKGMKFKQKMIWFKSHSSVQ